MLCPGCLTIYELKDAAPSLCGGGPVCPGNHCSKYECFRKCGECSDWLDAIADEEGKVVQPKAKLAPEESIVKIDEHPFYGWAARLKIVAGDPLPAFSIPEDVEIEVKAWTDNRNKKWTSKFTPAEKVDYQGTLAEISFLRYVLETGALHRLESKVDQKDRYDFEWNNRICDVKCSVLRGAGKMPAQFYASNVTEKQEHNRFCETYVFARYNQDDRIMYLVGWIDKKKWDAVKIYRKAGEPITPKYTPTESHYECKIYDLTPIGIFEEKSMREPEKVKPQPTAEPPNPKPEQGDIPW